MQPLLEYSQWRRFAEAIEQAKTACVNSGHDVDEHFADVGKMVEIGSGARRNVKDYELSRYACYLIVMNRDPLKEDLPTPEKSTKQIEKEHEKKKIEDK